MISIYTMHMKNIRSVDLNLLVLLKELLLEKNTVKVAKKLDMSQPAVSHALKRLRETFQDPLLVRASRGLVPTHRALELEGAVNALLKDAETIFNSPKNFDPGKANLVFRISTTDYFEQVILAKLLALFEKEAPGCTLILRPTLGALPKGELEEGSIDLAIAGFFGDLPENFYQQRIFEDDFVCVGKKAHPLLKGQLTLKKYAQAQHILISPQGDMKSKSRDILKRKGHTQKYLVGVSSFTSPGWVLTKTELLLTCPRKLAMAYMEFLPLQVAELPIELKKISVVQVWHGRSHSDPAQAWLRKLIYKVCNE
jgi:DNA-binding transcriptional LysR family regulator